MRKALIPTFVLVVAAIVLGSTLFREQIASAATPFTNVIVGNTSTNPVPVQQQGTAQVSGTVGLSSSANAIKIDPGANAVTPQPTLANAEDEDGLSGTGPLTHDLANGINASLVIVTLSSEATGIEFGNNGSAVLDLAGPAGTAPGQGNLILQLTQPIPMDTWTVNCATSQVCTGTVTVVGTAQS